jgi:hypothetical protein
MHRIDRIAMVLTIVFAMLNICLGFALAMYLGYGTPGFYKDFSRPGIDRVKTIAEPAAAPSSASPNLVDAAKK